jgi:hypothetical protein
MLVELSPAKASLLMLSLRQIAVGILLACGLGVPGYAQLPAFNHVFIVVEENHSYSSVIGDPSMPYLNSLASEYGLATKYYANTHPSLGNYFMLTTGQIITNNDNFTGTVTADNVVRHLLAAGKTWKVYAESLPSVGYLGGDTGLYVKHHNPFAYLSDVVNSSVQPMNIVPFTQLAIDLANNQLPDYAFIVPNVCDDAHDCTRAVADTWLQKNIDPLKSSTFQQNGLLIITFDESFSTDTTNGGGQVAWVVVSPKANLGYQSTTLYQHQNTLRLMIQGLGLSTFPGAASTASNMAEFFGGTNSSVSVSVTPSSSEVVRGFSANYTVTVNPVGSFAGTVALNVSGLPDGATATFNPPSVNISGSSVLTIATARNEESGKYSFTITGTTTNFSVGTTATLVIGRFVQANAATPQTPQSTVSVIFPKSQLPGDLNILVVGWKDTSSYILSIKDSAGNTYKTAVPRLSGVGLSQTIRYAPNIVGGPNTVTVTFNQAVPFPDVRIIEYGGPNTLDVALSARGNSLIASSGLVTTTAPEELLVSANTVATGTAGPGSGFKSRIITSPNGDIVEDGQVSAIGSFGATAPLTSSGQWIMQMATFK